MSFYATGALHVILRQKDQQTWLRKRLRTGKSVKPGDEALKSGPNGQNLHFIHQKQHKYYYL